MAKWRANVKNLQSSGIGNTALSMIADDLHKTIGQKFSVVKHDHGLGPKDWKTCLCKILISTLEKVNSETKLRADSENESLSKNIKFWGYRIDKTSTADTIQQAINDGVKLYTELENEAETNKEACKLLYNLVKFHNKPLYDNMTARGAEVDIDSFTKRLLREAETNAANLSRFLRLGFRFVGNGPQASDRKQDRSIEDTENNKGGKYKHNIAAGDHMPPLRKRRVKRMTMTLAISLVGAITDPRSARTRTPVIPK